MLIFLLKDFDKYVKAATFVASRSDLDLYLEEPLLDRNVEMDILEWWRSVEYRWPCLTVLARDVLSIPVTSVSSEAAFSVGGRILKPSRCSLSPDSVEALVCSRNWNFGLKGTRSLIHLFYFSDTLLVIIKMMD